MAAGSEVLVAVPFDALDEAVAALAGLEVSIEREDHDHVLLAAAFAHPDEGAEAVVSLRERGWPAIERPGASGHRLAWEHRYEPSTLRGGRLCVGAPWAAGRADIPMVEIDPGRAFGAGTHATTILLADELAGRLRGGESVLDAGCGTGVLGIVAARLGAGRVVGFDIDHAAIDATRANAVWNGVADRVTADRHELAAVPGSFDVIVANILAPVLVELAAAIVERLVPGGWLGLSGLSPAQVSLVTAAYRPLEVVSTTTRDDWAAVVLG